MLHADTAQCAAEQQQRPAQIRQVEVQDDDDDFVTSPVALPQAVAEEEELECRVVWDSSTSRGSKGAPPLAHGTQQEESASPAHTAAGHLKDQGNQLFKRGDAAGALKCYSQALELAGGATGPAVTAAEAAALPEAQRCLLATLHSNVSAAALKLGRVADAVAAALRARALRPDWPKPMHRLAEAQLAGGKFSAAVAACRAGEAGCAVDSEGRTQFAPLLDRIAVAAAAVGDLAGYDGRQLEVRCAGDEAWLGRPAPHVPALDGPLDEDSALPSDDLSAAAAAPAPPTPQLTTSAASASTQSAPAKQRDGKAGTGAGAVISAAAPGKKGDALAGWDYRDERALARRQRTSFRSVREALGAARDGDRVLLRRGVHNGMGESVEVGRRVLILGEGALGETVIDQRANVPTFRITRGGVVVANLDLDQTGFREAVLVAGGAAVAPLIDGCTIKCSGDDAVHVAGGAAPLLRRCTISAKKCGLRAYDAARPRLEGCTLEKCGTQGVAAMERSAVALASCSISDCGEEGVVVMQDASVALADCVIAGNKGPGVDVSGGGRASVSGGEIRGNVGGVWLWERATARLDKARIEGGPAQVILADGAAAPQAAGCRIKGTVHATDAAWRGLLEGGNQFLDPDAPTDFPPEEGPFRFVPNRFTRKQ